MPARCPPGRACDERLSRPDRLRSRPLLGKAVQAMTYETIDFKADGGIARITLNRPDKLNSFNVAMHHELREVLRDHLGGIRVVILTGAGRAFCAGQDLNER